MSDAIVTRSESFEPSSVEEALRMAKLLVSSKLLPDGIQTPEAAFAIILTGRELGLSAMMSLRSIHVIKGKPTLSADLILALVKRRQDVCEYFRLVETSELVARYETLRKGEPTPTTMSFSIEDAKRAGLMSNANWQKYPGAMLRARCIAALSRAVYPDVALGLYDPDELSQTEPTPAVRPDVPVVMLRAGSTFESDAMSATTAEQLNAVAIATKRAHASGAISDTELSLVATAVRTKRTELASAGVSESAND